MKIQEKIQKVLEKYNYKPIMHWFDDTNYADYYLYHVIVQVQDKYFCVNYDTGYDMFYETDGSMGRIYDKYPVLCKEVYIMNTMFPYSNECFTIEDIMNNPPIRKYVDEHYEEVIEEWFNDKNQKYDKLDNKVQWFYDRGPFWYDPRVNPRSYL